MAKDTAWSEAEEAGDESVFANRRYSFELAGLLKCVRVCARSHAEVLITEDDTFKHLADAHIKSSLTALGLWLF